MNDEKGKWIDDAFQSIKGSHRAKPPTELLGKIESEIFASKAKVIPMSQLRIAVAVAVLLLMFNVSALVKTAQNDNVVVNQMAESEVSNLPLISNYNIYE